MGLTRKFLNDLVVERAEPGLTTATAAGHVLPSSRSIFEIRAPVCGAAPPTTAQPTQANDSVMS